MAMGKVYLASKAKRTVRRPKSAPNRKLATVGVVKRLINRNIDKVGAISQAISAANVTTTAGIQALNPAGTTDCIYDSFDIRLVLKNPTLNVAVRLLFFQWKDTSTPTVADVLTVANPFGHFDDGDCIKRLKVLSDKTYSMNLFDKFLSLIAKNESVNIPSFFRESIILLRIPKSIPLICGLLTSGLGSFHFVLEIELIIGASNSVHVGKPPIGV